MLYDEGSGWVGRVRELVVIGDEFLWVGFGV